IALLYYLIFIPVSFRLIGMIPTEGFEGIALGILYLVVIGLGSLIFYIIAVAIAVKNKDKRTLGFLLGGAVCLGILIYLLVLNNNPHMYQK
ncbi:hypothetical protein, partial [Paenibacillus koleovorans]|uniref:hypothetical protein n=1 Tax=Paenibacillus koleovorans TaxID=121608 RepID=UPI001C3FB3A7